MNHYLQLANDLQERDPDSATLIRDLVGETVEDLVALERKALRRRFEPMSLVTVLILTVPSIAVLIWATTWDEWWRWIVIVFAALWTLVWGGVGVTQLFKHESSDEETSAEPSAGDTPE